MWRGSWNKLTVNPPFVPEQLDEFSSGLSVCAAMDCIRYCQPPLVPLLAVVYFTRNVMKPCKQRWEGFFQLGLAARFQALRHAYDHAGTHALMLCWSTVQSLTAAVAMQAIHNLLNRLVRN